MKFNKLFILWIASMLTFSGCDDFLDSQDYTGKNSTNFPSTTEDVNKMVAAVYKSTFYGPFQGNNLEQYFSVGKHHVGRHVWRCRSRRPLVARP